jgi:hypothetical protein
VRNTFRWLGRSLGVGVRKSTSILSFPAECLAQVDSSLQIRQKLTGYHRGFLEDGLNYCRCA